ncbi:MAG: tyrosine-type recombinase/integrase [Syntrophomonadaceae bacterium]|nr:tyrosine-type recombinase/integrase [Syntrophomonadaceae bacterium]MDD3890343.1 tyrosine-type recombinase/integrase [Syntrophomonadaceae bacterium]MDD4549472.1 tyrosine-type recombinase/integrase [Syntrophomonadaceae bacterium]
MKRRANNEGSIYQRKSDGRWVVHFPMPGRSKPIVAYCKTEQDAVEKLHELITAYKTGTYVDPNDITLSEWLHRWMTIYMEGEISDNWYARKLDLIRLHIDPYIGQTALQKIIPADIKLHYKKLSKTGKKVRVKDEEGNMQVQLTGLASQTVKHIHNILKPALQQAVYEGLIVKNPIDKVKAPKVTKTREVRILAEDELEKYFNELSRHRLYAAFVLELCTGLRRGELLGLKWPDINIHTQDDKIIGIITIQRQVLRVRNIDKPGSSLQYSRLKTESSFRSIVLPLCAITELQAHKNRQEQEKQLAGSSYNDEGLVFCTALGKKLDTRRLYEIHCRTLERAGIEHTAFHNLRHTVATLLLEKGENIKTIQELLGHADVSTSLNIYSHVLERMKAASAERLNGIIGNVLPTNKK